MIMLLGALLHLARFKKLIELASHCKISDGFLTEFFFFGW